MPFVMTSSSERMNSDIIYNKYEGGQLVEQGNRLKSIPLTSCDHLNYEGEATNFDELVVRGVPNKKAMNWQSSYMPVFRVQTHKFGTYGDDKQETWERFMNLFKEDNDFERGGRQTIKYEPRLSDIRPAEFGTDYSFPTWVIDEMLEMGFFEQALTQKAVNQPKIPRLTQDEYDAIMKEIPARKKYEADKAAALEKKAKEEADAKEKAKADKEAKKKAEEEAKKKQTDGNVSSTTKSSKKSTGK